MVISVDWDSLHWIIVQDHDSPITVTQKQGASIQKQKHLEDEAVELKRLPEWGLSSTTHHDRPRLQAQARPKQSAA